MPTRPRTGPSRTKKKTATPTAPEQSSAKRPNSAAEHESRSSEVTAARLKRREIPSFSVSREARIAEAAYWRAERRGFTGGQELDDWLAAEREIDGDTESERAEGSRPSQPRPSQR